MFALGVLRHLDFRTVTVSYQLEEHCLDFDALTASNDRDDLPLPEPGRVKRHGVGAPNLRNGERPHLEFLPNFMCGTDLVTLTELSTRWGGVGSRMILVSDT